jgi:hypothetical protein
MFLWAIFVLVPTVIIAIWSFPESKPGASKAWKLIRYFLVLLLLISIGIKSYRDAEEQASDVMNRLDRAVNLATAQIAVAQVNLGTLLDAQRDAAMMAVSEAKYDALLNDCTTEWQRYDLLEQQSALKADRLFRDAFFSDERELPELNALLLKNAEHLVDLVDLYDTTRNRVADSIEKQTEVKGLEEMVKVFRKSGLIRGGFQKFVDEQKNTPAKTIPESGIALARIVTCFSPTDKQSSPQAAI